MRQTGLTRCLKVYHAVLSPLYQSGLLVR